ncbi:hypothetical protein [uncultured Desulfovibrio sp.]|uniref:hypothetical protein n=1 Tax=uncultured Desulfovibrio sp. TaxID=167968 RepID=UPI00262CB1D3|nr:hypothetical protein [uncultured Desulfovibrio sp.]
MRIPARKIFGDPATEPSLNLLNGATLDHFPEHLVSPVSWRYIRAERIQAFLESAKEELKAYFGDYTYSLVEDWKAPKAERYKILAEYDLRGTRQYFVDGVGPTPWKALLAVNEMETFLRKLRVFG